MPQFLQKLAFDFPYNAGINVKTERWGGGGGVGGGTGKDAAFESFGNFLVKFPTLGTGK